MSDLYSSNEFEAKYTYTGTDLGAVWTEEKTLFRLWAPTAQEVTVSLYQAGDPDGDDLIEQLPMTPDVNGTWIAEKDGNLNGVYYTYLVMVDGKLNECCDPYAKTTGVNGYRAMVIDMASTNPEGWAEDKNPNAHLGITDAFLYELHVRDLSMHRSARIKNKGKYLGLTETGTTTKSGIPTGLDHIKSMGITHLHLLPVFDFGWTDESSRAPRFNWGYDPVNFNVPEGSYSSDAYDGFVRVKEFKQMVKGLHDNGISVVMDVVYNHVFEAKDFCFNNIVPDYFSRTDENGTYSNASCCGNDTASERSMVRKYIVDSVKYWTEEYHIDGFRFDLVGLIDIDTVNELMAEVKKTRPDVIFYGEGWTMPTKPTKPGVELCVQPNSHKVPGFAFFSDTIRDLMRGSVFYDDAPGYVHGAHVSKDDLKSCFMGVPQWCAEPSQSVNYVSCHDNNTLLDRLTLAAPDTPAEILIKMNNLAAAFSILSQGVPFMQAGEEMLRTKPGKKGGFDENSYRSPDKVNSIKWDNLEKEEYMHTVNYYRGLINFRKAHPSLRLSTREQVWKTVHPVSIGNDHVVAFRIDEGTNELFVAFNADTHDVILHLPEGKWDMHINGNTAGTGVIRTVSDQVMVAPISAMVLSRKKPVDVVAALIWEKDKFLICQRPANKARGLLWEFVGGKVEEGETMQQALRRECAEELAVNVSVGTQFMQVIHEYPDMLIRLTLFHCTIPEGFPQALEHNDLKWIHPAHTDGYDFCPADTDILKEIKRVYGNKIPL